MNQFAILASATTAIAAATSSLAGPLLTVQGSVGGYAPITASSNGAATATAGRYSYIGGVVSSFPSPDWAISWDLVGDDASVISTGAFVTNGFRVQNFTGASKTFDITLSLASPGRSGLTWDTYALLGGTLTSDAAGTTATLSSTGPLWTGMINGAAVPSSALMSGTYASTSTTTTFGPVNSASSTYVAAAMTNIGYRMQFTLGAKSTAIFSGYWEVVPSPGALALVGAAGLLGRRRRAAN